jgi:hypothetical protein
VLAADHGDGQLLVQRDAVQTVSVDRESHEAHVERALADPLLLLVLREGDQLERVAGESLTPGARPLVGRGSGDEADPEVAERLAHEALRRSWSGPRTSASPP